MPTQPTGLTNQLLEIKRLFDEKKKKHKEILDERYPSVSYYAEDEDERFDRIMDDDSCWSGFLKI